MRTSGRHEPSIMTELTLTGPSPSGLNGTPHGFASPLGHVGAIDRAPPTFNMRMWTNGWRGSATAPPPVRAPTRLVEIGVGEHRPLAVVELERGDAQVRRDSVSLSFDDRSLHSNPVRYDNRRGAPRDAKLRQFVSGEEGGCRSVRGLVLSHAVGALNLEDGVEERLECGRGRPS